MFLSLSLSAVKLFDEGVNAYVRVKDLWRRRKTVHASVYALALGMVRP